VHRRADEGGGWLGWVVEVKDIASVEERLGRLSVEGHRIRPDGVDLRWRQIGVLDLLDDPQVPFYVQWLTPEEHPSRSGSEIRLAVMEFCGDAGTLSEWLGVTQADLCACLDDIELRWVDSEDRGLVACEFDTPRGRVRID
jgi:hypothetical protein